MKNESKIIVLYFNEETETYHEILLNDLEESAIISKINEIFNAKGHNSVLINKIGYKLLEKRKDIKDEKTDSSNI